MSQKENEMRQHAQMVKELEWVLNLDDELVAGSRVLVSESLMVLICLLSQRKEMTRKLRIMYRRRIIYHLMVIRRIQI